MNRNDDAATATVGKCAWPLLEQTMTGGRARSLSK
jgi:hypothetical protein